MRALVLSPRWFAALLSLWACVLSQGVAAQEPLKATLFFRNPPPGLIYNPTAPITIVLQIANVSAAAVNTTDEFSAEEHWRRLFFTLSGGGIVKNTTGARLHRAEQVGFCLSRALVLQRPTALPVVPIEVLAGPTPPPGPPNPFFIEYVIADAKKFYDLTWPGRYTVNARIPLLTFVASNPDAVITNCDQFEGKTLANVAAVTGRQAFTIVSNSLEFVITDCSIERIVDIVASLVSLTPTQKQMLTTQLQAAIAKAKQGNKTEAIRMLEDFIRAVKSLVAQGRLTSAQGAALIEAAECAITLLKT